MKYALVVLFFSVVLLTNCQFSTGSHDLSTEYSFSLALHDNYTLYWNYDLKTISFAVRVRTEGWVGFGLSPTGQMPGSDVVIGWVDEQGNIFFHDRFAEGRFTPAIDDSQDWVLEFGEQENGYTILAFNRTLTSCDPNDLNIRADTSRVVWSWHSSDPSSVDGILQHQFSGSTSVNLLGGLKNPPPEPDDKDSFIIAQSNVIIPNDTDTTYWCSALQLPQEIRSQTRYVYKIAPAISEGNLPYVHHMLVYLCDSLDDAVVGQGAICDSAHVNITECQGDLIIGAWAVGGSEFIFPKDVALPIGGEGTRQYVVLEMHYDNPSLDSGVVDSSGLEYFYTNTKPKQEAGVLLIGHLVRPSMIIPPNSASYLIEGLCSEECSKNYFPPEGITVFGNGLHTHIYGKGLRVQHFRQNEQCNTLEELKPLDENLRYDFNYQQSSSLPEVKVMPGDSLTLQCFYNTTNRSTPVLGGESTRDEMCLSFIFYYPRIDLFYCGSFSTPPFSFSTFADKYVSEDQRVAFLNSLTFQAEDETIFSPILQSIDWTPEAIEDFKTSVINTTQRYFCFSDTGEFRSGTQAVPKSECPYQEANSCTGFEPLSCCERVQDNIAGKAVSTNSTSFGLWLWALIATLFGLNYYV